MERRLAGLYESIEAGAGLELADVGSRIRVRQKSLTAESERVIAERGPIAEVLDEEMWRAAAMFKELVQHCEEPARIRQFLALIVKKASIEGDSVTIEYWPERLASTVGDSQCSIIWLLDLGSNQGPTD